MFSTGNFSVTLEEIFSHVSEIELLAYYFNIDRLPIVIHSPLRKDDKPSLGFKLFDNKYVYYNDFSTGEKGNLISLLMKMWGKTFNSTLEKIYSDIPKITSTNTLISHNSSRAKYSSSTTILNVKTREWRNYDIAYWLSYGIPLFWLKYAEVYPISHTIITRDDITTSYTADKYAYAFIERKDGIITLKVYQPFNTKGYKWINKHDGSVVSLWTKVPKKGNRICICSSLKDALCLEANTHIPAIALQGEGYTMSNSAISNLKERFEQVYVLFDNDEAGILGGEKLSKETGFTNIVLPKINNSKDISDLYKSLEDKKEFKTIILNLFNDIR